MENTVAASRVAADECVSRGIRAICVIRVPPGERVASGDECITGGAVVNGQIQNIRTIVIDTRGSIRSSIPRIAVASRDCR